MTILVWWLTCIVWSTVWLAIKLGVTDVPPFGFAAARLAIALLILASIIAVQRRVLPATWRQWQIIFATGVLLLGVNYMLLYWAAQYIASGMTAVLQSTTPLFALLFGHFVLRTDRVTGATVAPLIVGILGVLLIFWTELRLSGQRELFAACAAAGSAATVALGYALVVRYAAQVDAIVLMAGQMTSGVAVLLALSVALEGSPLGFDWTRPAIVSLVYLAVAGSVAAFWLNYWLLRRMSATKMLMTSIVEPMLAVALGAVFLHERFSASALAGSGLILVSVILTVRAR